MHFLGVKSNKKNNEEIKTAGYSPIIAYSPFVAVGNFVFSNVGS